MWRDVATWTAMSESPTQPTTDRAGAAAPRPSVVSSDRSTGNELGDVVDLVKQYARQETLGPLRGAGRWIAFGIAGAISLSVAAVFAVLGVLRLLQNEFAPTFAGRWMSLVPYLVAIVTSLVVIGVTISRISRPSLHED